MKRISLLLFLALMLSACQTETRVIRDNSAATKFGSLFGGETTTSSGNGPWDIQRGGDQRRPLTPQEIAIRNATPPSNNFKGMKIVTSFQTDEDRAREAAERANAAPSAMQQSPWGAIPAAPTGGK